MKNKTTKNVVATVLILCAIVVIFFFVRTAILVNRFWQGQIQVIQQLSNDALKPASPSQASGKPKPAKGKAPERTAVHKEANKGVGL